MDQVIVAPNSYIQLKFILECVNIDIDFFWRKYELIDDKWQSVSVETVNPIEDAYSSWP